MGLIDLSWAVDSVLDPLPRDGKAPQEGSFHVSNRLVNSVVGPTEEDRDEVDAEK